MIKQFIQRCLFIFILLTAGTASAASGSHAGTEPANFSAAEVAAFAKQVERTVAGQGARVFLIARQGRPADELPDGINYTHTAFGVYSSITMEDGSTVPGYAIYNLYQQADDPDVSELVVDYPAEFFAGAHALKAGIVIPSPALQQRLLEVITSDTYRKLHNPRYSVIANPFNSRYQNCTEHTLDVLNAAIYRTDDIDSLKRNASAWYEPQRIEVGPFKLLLGSLFVEDVASSDHDGPIATATFTTISRYLETYDLVDQVMTITPAQDG